MRENDFSGEFYTLRTHLNSLGICFVIAICVATSLPPTYCAAQTSGGEMQASPMGGSNTGAPHAAVLDAEHRPITAGGFVKTGPVLFKDNGHVYPVADQVSWGTSWAERPLLFHNIGGTRFDLMPAVEGTALAKIYAGRGLAVGDLFNDGKLDVVINVLDGVPALLRNVSPDKNHWIELKLVGGPKSPRDAVGATVYLTANKVQQRGDVISGGSYESSSDQRLHFGLGDSTGIDAVEVHWPSGAKERFSVQHVDRIVTLTEGTGMSIR